MPEEEREPGPMTTKYFLTVARAMEKKKGGKVSRQEEVVARKQEVMVARKVEKMVGMMAMKGDRAIERTLLVMGVATVWKKRKMRLARKTVERKIRLERKILRRAKEKGRMLQRKEGAGYQTVPGKALSQRGLRLTMGLQVAR